MTPESGHYAILVGLSGGLNGPFGLQRPLPPNEARGHRGGPCTPWLWTFGLKRCVATQDVEVVVAMEQGRRSSDGNGSDEAVDQLSHCFPVAATRLYRVAGSS